MTEITYTIETEKAGIDYFEYGDHDLITREDVERRWKDGDPWGWCYARVLATCGQFRTMSYWLGPFTCESQEDFILSSDYEYMEKEARRMLLGNMKRSAELYALLSDEEVVKNLREASDLYKQLTANN